jgi:hypothetical protein
VNPRKATVGGFCRIQEGNQVFKIFKKSSGVHEEPGISTT